MILLIIDLCNDKPKEKLSFNVGDILTNKVVIRRVANE